MGVGDGLVLDVGEVAGVLIAEGMALVLDVDGDGAVSMGTASPGCSWYCAFTACCSWYARAVLALMGYNKTSQPFLKHDKVALSVPTGLITPIMPLGVQEPRAVQ